MAKGKRKDPEATAREKLTDAQAKLAAAQERRRRIAAEGEKEVDVARRRAADRLAQATRDVERRAAKVARAESKLLGLQSKQQPAAPPRSESVPVLEAHEPETASPVTAADHVEAIAAEAQPAAAEDGAEPPADESDSAIGRNERRLLAALRANFTDEGATFTQWLAATQLSKRTFLRARRSLVESGMVTHNGAGPGAHYRLTDSGRSESEG